MGSINLLTLFVTLALSSKAFDKGVEDAKGKSSGLADKIKSGFGTAVKAIGAAIVSATTAVAAGIAKLTQASLASYGEYEQLVGGVETLFKQSSDVVQQYAANAYKTAGMSANEYMETVTSFSASLLQSLGGDTESASKYADMAITDMSDKQKSVRLKRIELCQRCAA